MHIPRCYICQRAHPLILELKFHGLVGLGRCGFMNAMTRLNTGFLVGTDDIFLTVKWLAIPDTMIHVQNTPGLILKIGIAGKNPTTLLPWLDRILAEPTPHCGAADGCSNASLHGQLRDLACGEPRQRFVEFRWQLAGQRLNLHGDLRGKKQGAFPALAHPQGQQVVVQRIAFATCSRSAWASRASCRCRHC